MIAAQYGLPTSSSQCITGGIIGCGLLEGTAGVNWRFFAVQFISWIATLFVVALGTGALFAAGAYAPSVNCGNDVIVYEDYLVASHNRALRELNDTISGMLDAARYTGAEAPLFKRIGSPNEPWLLNLRRQINWAVSNVTLMSNTKGQTSESRAVPLLSSSALTRLVPPYLCGSALFTAGQHAHSSLESI